MCSSFILVRDFRGKAVSDRRINLLIAASGTGGHLFPALGLAQQLPEYQIAWLGVPDRLEQSLVPKSYPLHTISVAGFQDGLGIKTIKTAFNLLSSISQVRKLIKEKQIDAVFTTGGYIAAPAILAASWAKIPAILHESNYIPGKVTRILSGFCHTVAIGFRGTEKYLPRVDTVYVSTPVREEFLSPQPLALPIPATAKLIVVTGGSQGAVAVNQLVREAAPQWLKTGAYIVHLTGDRDPDKDSFQHPQYISLPFYDNMAGLLQRADLAISRAGAGTLTELAVTKTPAILIPYPYAAENHQTYNAQVFAEAGAALVYSQAKLTKEILGNEVLNLLNSPEILRNMTQATAALAVTNSAELLANIVKEAVTKD